MHDFAPTETALRQRREPVVFVNPQVAAPAAWLAQQAVAVPHKGRHAKRVIIRFCVLFCAVVAQKVIIILLIYFE